MTALLQSPAACESFRAALTSDPAVALDVYREPEYLARQARGVDRLFSVLKAGIGAITAIGAAFAAACTMFAAVSLRTREIATLQAIGYAQCPPGWQCSRKAPCSRPWARCSAPPWRGSHSTAGWSAPLSSGQPADLLVELQVGALYFPGAAALASFVGLAGGLDPFSWPCFCASPEEGPYVDFLAASM